ncbi:MAG: hypothetical protein ACTS7C_00495 [Candidatus Hodgkinia cicadicola]
MLCARRKVYEVTECPTKKKIIEELGCRELNFEMWDWTRMQNISIAGRWTDAIRNETVQGKTNEK